MKKPFHLTDGLILIAFTALGLAGSKLVWDDRPYFLIARDQVTRLRTMSALLGCANEFIGLGLPCLSAWSLALVILRCRQPRSPLRKIVRRLGGVICIIVSLHFCIVAAHSLATLASPFWSGLPATGSGSLLSDVRIIAKHVLNIAEESTAQIAFGIFVAWTVFLFLGRRRSHGDWVDSALVIVSIIWCCVSLIHWMFFVDWVYAK